MPGCDLLTLRSQREIQQMRTAGLVVWRAHQQAGSLIRPGVTTRQIDAEVEAVFLQQDARPLFQGVAGTTPFPTVSCISVNDEVVHGIPSDRILHEGDVVSVDIGCKLRGWCADAAVTHPVGRISADVEHLLTITRGVLQLAIERMERCEWWSQVAKDMFDYVEDEELSVVTQFVGHGIGRELHEDPQVPNFVIDEFLKDGDFRIRPGLVVAIEPMVNIGSVEVEVRGDHWTQVTVDGSYSAHFEHTVAMTQDGPRVLTGPPAAGEEG